MKDIKLKLVCICLALLLSPSLAQSKSFPEPIQARNYWAIKPLNLFFLAPGFQYGTLLSSDSIKHKIYLDMGLTYPFLKAYWEAQQNSDDHYSLSEMKGLLDLRADFHLRRISKANRFIGPVAEVEYKKWEHKYFSLYKLSPASSSEHYLMFRLGFHVGKYYKAKNPKYMNAVFFGAAARYVIDFADPRPKYQDIGLYQDKQYGLRVFLNWQFGRILSNGR